MTLAQRLYDHALMKFNGNKCQAIAYLRGQAMFYARKADRYYKTSLHDAWRKVYRAYSSAEFTMSYHLDLDEQFYRETCEEML